MKALVEVQENDQELEEFCPLVLKSLQWRWVSTVAEASCGRTGLSGAVGQRTSPVSAALHQLQICFFITASPIHEKPTKAMLSFLFSLIFHW